MEYTLTSEEFKQIRDGVGCGVQEVQRTLAALNLRREVIAAKTVDDIKPAIMSILSSDINSRILEQILDKIALNQQGDE